MSGEFPWKRWRDRVAEKKSGKIAITQVRSTSGRPRNHRRTLEALGFKHHQQTVVHEDNPAIRGMIRQVSHLVSVEPYEE